MICTGWTNRLFSRSAAVDRILLVVVSCVVLIVCDTPVQAGTTTLDPYARVVDEQKDDNKRWEKEAKSEEASLGSIADQYYKEKDYRKAREYYQKVLRLRFDQWDFPGRRGGKQLPARDKYSEKLHTSHTLSLIHI